MATREPLEPPTEEAIPTNEDAINPTVRHARIMRGALTAHEPVEPPDASLNGDGTGKQTVRHDSPMEDALAAQEPLDPPTECASSTGKGAAEQAVRHGSSMEDAPPMTLTEMLRNKAAIESQMRRQNRRDSVLSDGAQPSTEAKETLATPSSTGKIAGLGSSILKTPSSKSKSPAIAPAIAALKEVGSTWLTRYGSELWPVIICNEKTAPAAFMKTRRDLSHLPAILLGKRIYIWTESEHLKPFYTGCDYLSNVKRFDTDDVLSDDTEEDRMEKLRQRAYRTDAMLGVDHKFFMNVIEQEREARKIRNLQQQKSYKRTFRDTVDGYYRVGKKRSTNGDQRGETRSGLAMKRSYDLISSNGSEGTEDDSDSLFVNDAEKRSHRHHEKAKEDTEDKAEKIAAAQERFQANYRRQVENMQGTCTIFVGPAKDRASFKVPNNVLGQCLMLAGMLQQTQSLDPNNQDTAIEIHEHLGIEPDDLKVVATYLTKGYFEPLVVKGSSGKPAACPFQHQAGLNDSLADVLQIEGARTQKTADKHAKTIARAYKTASKLRFGSMQEHCVDKLCLLPGLSPQALIEVTWLLDRTQRHESAAETAMEEWLVGEIVAGRRDLSGQHGEALGRAMRSDSGLRAKVMRRARGSLERGGEDSGEDSGSE